MNIRYLVVLSLGLIVSACSDGVSTSSASSARLPSSESVRILEDDSVVTTENTADSDTGDSSFLFPDDTTTTENTGTQHETTDNQNSDSPLTGDSEVPTNTDTEPSPDYNFTLTVDNHRRALEEGDSSGTTFTISAAPAGNQSIDVEIRAVSDADESGVSVVLAEQQLSGAGDSTTINFALSVGMRPRLENERRFEVIARSGDETRSVELILDVKPIDAPDVYLLIGQSNMVGRTGDNSKDATSGGFDETHPRIRQLNVTRNDPGLYRSTDDYSNPDLAARTPRYTRAQDPLHIPLKSDSDSKSGTTIGPGLSFAKAALESTTQDIYLVPAAWEASGFCRNMSADTHLAWNASETDNTSLGGVGLLERALIRLRITMRDTDGIFRGILWLQGEGDSTNQACADSYEENLKLMVERIRSEAREDDRGESARGEQASIPFIVATMSKGEDDRGDFSLWDSEKRKVDSVHRIIASVVPFSDWVNSDDLVPPAYPCGSTGCIHFGPQASREIGRRFYAAIERVWLEADE